MNKNKMLVKALSGTLCAAMLMTNITPVFAATIENQSTSNETDSKETEVLYNKSASYFVTIPKTIVLDSDKTSAYGVKVDGDIPSDQEVYVSPIDEITDKDGFNFYMKDQSIKNAKADVVADVTQSKFYWDFEDAANGYEETNNSISATDLSSGVWKGTFDFEINMHKIKNETGLTLSTDGDVTMGLDDSVQVNAYMDGETVTNDVTWTSNNSAISVENGLIQTSASAEVGDSAIITVMANNEIESVEEDNKIAPLGIMTAHADEEMTASFKVTIVDIELSSYDLYIEPGESATLNATILPLETKGTVNWTRTAISGLNLNKNGNSVEISVSSDMEVGKTYQVVASFGDFSKVCTIHVGEKETHNHNYKSEVTKEPTCTEEGEKTYTCVDGDDSYTETIPALGHDYVNGVCTRCGDEKALEAGLYDASGNMLVSWQDSGIDIETDYTYASSTSSKTSGTYVLKNKYPNTTKVVLPDNITKIGAYAFNLCSNLTEIQLQNNVTSIETCAFSQTGLKEINLPSSLHNIGLNAFANCYNLETINGGENVSTIAVDRGIGKEFADTLWYKNKQANKELITLGHVVIDGSTLSGDVVIPEGMTQIMTGAFAIIDWSTHANDKITSVSIPDSVTLISPYAFNQCTNLTSVTIPNNVTTIGNSAFSDCTKLSSVVLSNKLETIGYGAFARCNNLTNITLPDSLKSIGAKAFVGTGLSKIYIPSSVDTIKSGTLWGIGGYKAAPVDSPFFGCNTLKIYCGAPAKQAGWEAYWNCYYAKYVSGDAANTQYTNMAYLNAIYGVTREQYNAM